MHGIRMAGLVSMTLPLLVVGCSVKATDGGQPARASSGFAADDDGWRVQGDAQTTSVKPGYSGTGGKPDGLITATDGGGGGGGTWYFVAPEKYLVDQSSTYGQTLRFDLKVDKVPASPFDAADVILRSGDVQVKFNTLTNPTTEWTSYAVSLSEGDWHLGNLDARPPTADEMKSVLGDVTAFWIRGEFNTGPDMGYLDNVSFGDPR